VSHVLRDAIFCSVCKIGGVSDAIGVSASHLERSQFAVENFDFFEVRLTLTLKNLGH